MLNLVLKIRLVIFAISNFQFFCAVIDINFGSIKVPFQMFKTPKFQVNKIE